MSIDLNGLSAKELEALIASVEAAPAELSVGDYLVSNWFQSTVESPLAQAFLSIDLS